MRYRLEEVAEPIGWEHRHDCSLASRTELLWYYFPGDIEMMTDRVVFGTNFGWVPVLHFCFSTVRISKEMASGQGRSEYYFTEANEWMVYKRNDLAVNIECSYAPGIMTVSIDELRSVSTDFARRVLVELGDSHPSLWRNPFIKEFEMALR